jgi:hypothetical protein
VISRSASLTFAGYEVIPGDPPERARARIFTTGPADPEHPLQAQVIHPGQKNAQTLPLYYEPQTQLWKSGELLPLGTEYRFDLPGLKQIQARIIQPAPPNVEPKALELHRHHGFWQSDKRLRPGTTVQIPIQGLPPVEVEAVFPDGNARPLQPRLDGAYWSVTTDSQWRDGSKIRVKTAPDWVETVERNGLTFNRISPLETSFPRKNGPMADIFLDSLLPLEELAKLTGLNPESLQGKPAKRRKQLAEWVSQNSHLLPARNHFNRYGGNEKGLEELLPVLHRVGIRSLLTKPFIGGDNLSSHRYWTVDPFVLNSSFSGKQAFQRFLNTALDHGMKLYNDGAFVTQGLNGAQFLSLITDRQNSPYWHWFTHPEEINRRRIDHTGKLTLPRLAHDGMVFGVLPTRLLTNGHRVIDFEHFDFRIINNPDAPDYDSRKPTLIELYDPTVQAEDGTPRPHDRVILHSEDSVQNYRFPVPVEELKEKNRQIASRKLTDTERKRLMMEWKHFRLKEAALDNSTHKWDGQINVAKMNMRNPEVIAYLKDAVQYWTRFVSTTYIDRVAQALHRARLENPDAKPETLIQKITNPTSKPNPAYALPPVEFPELETLTPGEIKQALNQITRGEADAVPASLAKKLLNEYPLMALELPITFKSILSYPDLRPALQGTSEHRFQKLWREVIQNDASRIPFIGAGFETFERRLQKKMAEVVSRLTPQAQEKLKDPQLQSLILNQLAETLFMKIFTDLDVSNPQTADNLTAQQVEDALYRVVPGSILRNNPISASKLLPGFMKQRLEHVSSEPLAKLLETRLQNLDSESVALAKAVLNKREFGLNWRLDAAKDVADMDKVFNAEPEDRPWLFQEEMRFIRHFWSTLSGVIRREFPKSSIIAELTDFETLSNEQVAKEEMASMLSSSGINGTPNMRFLFSSLVEAISHSPRPHEHRNSIISPTGFLLNAARMSSQAYPNPAVQNNQNLTSSHDFLTTAHALLLNTDIWMMDYLRWWGLADDLRETCDELLSKPCFEAQRERLDAEVPQWRSVLAKISGRMQNAYDEASWQRSEKLRGRLKNPAHRQYFNEVSKSNTDGALLLELSRQSPEKIEALFAVIPPGSLEVDARQVEMIKRVLLQGAPRSGEAQELLDQLRKAPGMGHALYRMRLLLDAPEIRAQLPQSVVEAFHATREAPQNAATPFELKGSFVEDLLTNALPPHELGLSQKEASIIRDVLRTRMSEHSEDRAMRAVIMNNWLRLTEDDNSAWNKITRASGLLPRDNGELKQAMTRSLWRALDKTIREYPRHFGYQPLDTALDNVFKNLDSTWQNALPERIKRDPQRVQALVKNIQEALYQQANRPVMDKLLRIFALQCALPGNPSVYLHDLFAQSGGEWIKNAFVQNRALIRTDRLETEAGMREFMDAAAGIFGQRSKLPALTSGQLIPITPDDEHGVIPIVRSNGQDQVIVLVNTGKPQSLDSRNKLKTEAFYPEVTSTSPLLNDYKPNLIELHARPGTVYRDVNTGERFKINAQGQLVSLRGEGMKLGIYRILQRENTGMQLKG